MKKLILQIPLGIRYMIFATLFYTVMNAMIKLIPRIPAIEIVLFRSVVSLFLCLIPLRKNKINIWGNNKKLLLLRGFFGMGSLFLFFVTLKNIPLGSAVTIINMAPIFTALIASFLLKEYLFKIQWLFFTVSFIGVLLIKQFDPSISYYYLGIGILASLFMGFAYNCIRMIKSTEHPLVIIFYFPLVCIPIASFACIFYWVQPDLKEFLFLIALGIMTQVAQYFMTRAYQLEEAAKVSNINYLGVIFGVVIGVYLFDELYTIKTLFGISLVLAGVIMNLFAKKINQKFKSVFQ